MACLPFQIKRKAGHTAFNAPRTCRIFESPAHTLHCRAARHSRRRCACICTAHARRPRHWPAPLRQPAPPAPPAGQRSTVQGPRFKPSTLSTRASSNTLTPEAPTVPGCTGPAKFLGATPSASGLRSTGKSRRRTCAKAAQAAPAASSWTVTYMCPLTNSGATRMWTPWSQICGLCQARFLQPSPRYIKLSGHLHPFRTRWTAQIATRAERCSLALGRESHNPRRLH